MGNNMKRITCVAMLACLGISTQAQSVMTQQQDSTALKFLNEGQQHYIPVFEYWKEHNILQHLDVSLTAGFSGIGFDVASPIGDYVQVRAGYEFMPRFQKTMKFDLTIGGKPARSYDADGNREATSFDKMKELLYQFTGYDVEDHADMVGKPTMNNFKLLVDVFPFKQNKHWHFTAGFYWGPSQFALADNSTQSMVSLLSVGMYNTMYEKIINDEPLVDLGMIDSKYQGVNFYGDDNMDIIREKFIQYGRLGFSLGTFKHDMVDANGVEHHAGDSYIVEPDEDGMVHVTAKSKSFKPYLGFGYGGRLLKNHDDWKVSFDCGAMFWGGTPDLYVHDGVNLAEDVENLHGKVGAYVDVFKAFKVYPMLTFRLTKTIF